MASTRHKLDTHARWPNYANTNIKRQRWKRSKDEREKSTQWRRERGRTYTDTRSPRNEVIAQHTCSTKVCRICSYFASIPIRSVHHCHGTSKNLFVSCCCFEHNNISEIWSSSHTFVYVQNHFCHLNMYMSKNRDRRRPSAHWWARERGKIPMYAI